MGAARVHEEVEDTNFPLRQDTSTGQKDEIASEHKVAAANFFVKKDE